jgi:phosphate uptake regulator
MKRKAIKLGSNSLLVSLPSNWVKKHGIRKGDELSLEEKDGKLILHSTSAPANQRAAIDITELKHLTKRALGALYKKGYDEFTINFSSHEELEQAYEVIREEFTGFEVVQHGKHHLVAREISQPHADQFDTVLRRQFLVIKDFGSETATALASGDHAWLKRLVLRDKDVNKLADFCRRLINKQQAAQTATALYCIVEQLEKISDRYRDISGYASEQRLKPGKALLQAYADTNAFVDQFYQCFYQFSLPSLNAFSAKRKELLASLDKARAKLRPEEQRVLYWLEDIVEKTFDLNGPLMVLRL